MNGMTKIQVLNGDQEMMTEKGIVQTVFFDHPVIIDLLTDRWCGGYQFRKLSRQCWFFLTLWSLFDIVLFPFIFLLTYRIGMQEKYKTYFTIPYFIFVRDTISYLALLALHLAICVEPSQLSFSSLEWTILGFLLGRLLNEIRQIKDLLKQQRELAVKRLKNAVTEYVILRAPGKELILNYIRDRWNIFDFFILIVFVCAILPLRIVTWLESESITNNRALVIAGYLYGFNTMLLTFRAFGSILEAFQGVGTVQIAFFHIVRDAVVVVLHFLAIMLAFSSTITKVFMAEKSMVKPDDIIGKQSACSQTGIQCWKKMASNLAWSLLNLSEGLSSLKSVDTFSEALAHLLYAVYLVLALILLINMLIALLSNTYQRVQDNSRNEWVFRKAITVQTYRNYSPIPVPLNIVSFLGEWIYRYCKKKAEEAGQKTFKTREPQLGVKYLLDRYRLKYGDSFPPTNLLNQVLDDAENTECMVNQVLYRAFANQQGSDKALLPTGQEAWEAHEAVLVEGYLITHQPYVCKVNRCGARYRTAFSPRFPHFEVMILESGETRWFGLGVVFEDYGTDLMPGWRKGTVGYHTDDRKIYDPIERNNGRKTIGSTAARRGDVIRCTVVFDKEQETDGKIRVPVVFSVNGSTIVPEDKQPCYIEFSADRPLFPYLAFYYENSILAKMCAREDIDFQGQEMKANLTEVETKLEAKLECMQKKLDVLLAKLNEN